MASDFEVDQKHIISVPFEEKIDLSKNLGQYFWESFTKYNDKIAQINSTTGETETYGELLNRCIKLAQALENKGITSKDVIAYCSFNNMHYAATFAAGMFIGAILNPVDISASKDEIFHCLSISEPKIIFCDSEIEDVLEEAKKINNLNYDIIVYDESHKNLMFNDFIEKYKSESIKDFKINTSKTGNDTACICYTSGTSGASKGAQLTHFGLYNCGFPGFKCFRKPEILMIVTLPYWISNTSFVMIAFLYGKTRIICKSFNKQNLCKILHDYKVNSTIFNQLMINELIQNPQYCNYEMPEFKVVLYGGSNIGINQITRLRKLFPATQFYNGYGMTEASGAVFVAENKINMQDSRFSVGKPTSGFSYKIVDPETEKILGPNETGELRYKYPGMINGYIKNPEATKNAFDADGFFKSGDIFYYDEDLFFYIVDRLKEIFKYRGYHISPVKIENEIMSHPAVKECAVFGYPDDLCGELPMGAVVLKENSNVTETELVDYVNGRLADTYHIRAGLKFISEIPKTTTGKMKRNYLREKILNKEI